MGSVADMMFCLKYRLSAISTSSYAFVSLGI